MVALIIVHWPPVLQGSYLTIVFSGDKALSERVKKVTDTVMKLQTLGDSLSRLDVDATEYAYLKTLTMFNSGMREIEKMSKQMEILLREEEVEGIGECMSIACSQICTLIDLII